LNGFQQTYQFLMFDVDNTLMDFSAGEKAALFQTMEELGTPIGDDDHKKYLEINAGVWLRFEQGLLDSKAVQRIRFEEFAEHLDRDPAEALLLNDAYVENLGKQAIMLDGAMEMLHKLKERYQIAVVTNGLHLVQRARLTRSGLLPLLDGVFISQEMGVQKPDKAYFDEVFRTYGDRDKRKYLMIGDSLSADIQGGINAGVDTCWYHPSGTAAEGAITPTYTVRDFSEMTRLLLP